MMPMAQRPTHTIFYLYSATRPSLSVRRELERPRNSLLTLIPEFTHYITTSGLLTSQLSLSPGSPLLSSLHWSSLPGNPQERKNFHNCEAIYKAR
jgi:hypothetical protein